MVRRSPPAGAGTASLGGAWQGGDGGAAPRGKWQLVLLGGWAADARVRSFRSAAHCRSCNLHPGSGANTRSVWFLCTVAPCSGHPHSRHRWLANANCPACRTCQGIACLLPSPGCTAADHGLYRRLDDAFRLEYAGLWHSLVFAGGWLAGWPSRAQHRCDAAASLQLGR